MLPRPVDCREISRPRAIHPGRAAFATRLRHVLSIFAISENYSLEVKNIWTMKRYLLAIAAEKKVEEKQRKAAERAKNAAEREAAKAAKLKK